MFVDFIVNFGVSLQSDIQPHWQMSTILLFRETGHYTNG